jgi:hypothetical protein
MVMASNKVQKGTIQIIKQSTNSGFSKLFFKPIIQTKQQDSHVTGRFKTVQGKKLIGTKPWH